MIERVNPKKKDRLTLRELLDNSAKLLGPLKQDRTIKLRDMKPYIGARWIRFNMTSTGDPEEGKFYELTMIFYNVDFSDEKDEKHPVDIVVTPKGGARMIKWMEQLRVNKHPVAAFCSCPSFRFHFEWYIDKVGSLAAGRKPRPYTKSVTNPRPSVNPTGLKGICKHLYQAALSLRERGYLLGDLETYSKGVKPKVKIKTKPKVKAKPSRAKLAMARLKTKRKKKLK